MRRVPHPSDEPSFPRRERPKPPRRVPFAALRDAVSSRGNTTTICRAVQTFHPLFTVGSWCKACRLRANCRDVKGCALKKFHARIGTDSPSTDTFSGTTDKVIHNMWCLSPGMAPRKNHQSAISGSCSVSMAGCCGDGADPTSAQGRLALNGRCINSLQPCPEASGYTCKAGPQGPTARSAREPSHPICRGSKPQGATLLTRRPDASGCKPAYRRPPPAVETARQTAREIACVTASETGDKNDAPSARPVSALPSELAPPRGTGDPRPMTNPQQRTTRPGSRSE